MKKSIILSILLAISVFLLGCTTNTANTTSVHTIEESVLSGILSDIDSIKEENQLLKEMLGTILEHIDQFTSNKENIDSQSIEKNESNIDVTDKGLETTTNFTNILDEDSDQDIWLQQGESKI